MIAYDAASNSGQDASDADFEIYDPASGVLGELDAPTSLVLVGNVPNPFNGTTTILFGMPAAGRIQMDVYDVSGRKVAGLADGQFGPGYHRVEWQAQSGRGIYFVRLRQGAEAVTHKIVAE